jgi:hypothetical protein
MRPCLWPIVVRSKYSQSCAPHLGSSCARSRCPPCRARDRRCQHSQTRSFKAHEGRHCEDWSHIIPAKESSYGSYARKMSMQRTATIKTCHTHRVLTPSCVVSRHIALDHFCEQSGDSRKKVRREFGHVVSSRCAGPAFQTAGIQFQQVEAEALRES